MTKSSVFLLVMVGQVCLLLCSVYRAHPLSTHTQQLPMAFYTYSLLCPIHAVCCSKLTKLPPHQWCIVLQGTEGTTWSVLYAVWSYDRLYPQCQYMYNYLLPPHPANSYMSRPSAAFTPEGSLSTFLPPPSTCFTSPLAIAPHLCTIRQRWTYVRKAEMKERTYVQ